MQSIHTQAHGYQPRVAWREGLYVLVTVQLQGIIIASVCLHFAEAAIEGIATDMSTDALRLPVASAEALNRIPASSTKLELYDLQFNDEFGFEVSFCLWDEELQAICLVCRSERVLVNLITPKDSNVEILSDHARSRSGCLLGLPPVATGQAVVMIHVCVV